MNSKLLYYRTSKQIWDFISTTYPKHRLLDAEHVKQMILQVLFTNPGERINRPDFGCGIRRMVFAPNDDVTASLTQITILQALNTWLGSLITVQDVKVIANNERLEIGISYSLKAQSGPQYLNVEVSI
ncbi:MAG: GPW/gp25 family protein [Bacteroidia bacterium]|nr:GPW/gp25 family protein [Bacteroidia bacterium]